jgi:hypothetical protein
MLVFLRGPVPPEQQGPSRIVSTGGDLYHGPSDRVSARKFRLFVAASALRLWFLPLDDRSKDVLAAFFRYTDGVGSREDFFAACVRIQEAHPETSFVSHLAGAMWSDDPAGASWAAMEIASAIAWGAAKDSVAITCADADEDERFTWGFCGPEDPHWQAVRAIEEKFQADLLRHIVGNPFRTVRLDPAWLCWNDGIVGKLAQAIYDERAFDRMPVLGDALEEASCTNEAILSHCRERGGHVRGCWVLDQLIGQGWLAHAPVVTA